TPVGKLGLNLVPSAAQLRSLRKGSNDQLAITIDSQSERLLNNKSRTFEDKGRIFKPLEHKPADGGSNLPSAQKDIVAARKRVTKCFAYTR
ncbi:unnamed protein product, partial [Lactuca virosa]